MRLQVRAKKVTTKAEIDDVELDITGCDEDQILEQITDKITLLHILSHFCTNDIERAYKKIVTIREEG